MRGLGYNGRMPKPYDATLNALLSVRPEDWAAHFGRIAGIPPGPAETLDTDLATTVQSDRVFRIAGASPALLHLELESDARLGTPRELLRYNTLLDLQYDLPVETVLVLLRPKADTSDRTGVYERIGPSGATVCRFRYSVVRVWELSVAQWLACGPGLAPLALLTEEATTDLESAVARVRDTVRETAPNPDVAETVFASSFILCGLRHNMDLAKEIFRSLHMIMEDSSTYQGVVTIGRVLERREMVLWLGTKRFGAPPENVSTVLKSITDLNQLQRLSDFALTATGWDDLLRGV